MHLYVCDITLEHYSAVRKKEILPFATPCVRVECIVRTEISWTKTNTTCSHLYVGSKKAELQYQRVESWLPWVITGLGKCCLRVQTLN